MWFLAPHAPQMTKTRVLAQARRSGARRPSRHALGVGAARGGKPPAVVGPPVGLAADRAVVIIAGGGDT